MSKNNLKNQDFKFIVVPSEDNFKDKTNVQYEIGFSVYLWILNQSDGVLFCETSMGVLSLDIGEQILFLGFTDAPLSGYIKFDFSQIANVNVKIRNSQLTKPK